MLHVTNKPSKPLYLITGCISFLLLLLFTSGCGCGDDPGYYPFLLIDIKSKETGKNIYGWEGVWPMDSLSIYTDSDKHIEFSIDESVGLINMNFPNPPNSDPFNEKTTVVYYFQYLAQIIDTIKFEYQLKETKCSEFLFSSVDVFFNDSLVYQNVKQRNFEFYIE